MLQANTQPGIEHYDGYDKQEPVGNELHCWFNLLPVLPSVCVDWRPNPHVSHGQIVDPLTAVYKSLP